MSYTKNWNLISINDVERWGYVMILNTVRTSSVQKLYLLSIWKIERDLLIESASKQQEICNLILSQPTIHALPDIIKDRTELAHRRPWYKVLALGGSSLTAWWAECRFHSSSSRSTLLYKRPLFLGVLTDGITAPPPPLKPLSAGVNREWLRVARKPLQDFL